MKIFTAQFVPLSEIFRGLDMLRDGFDNTDMRFTYGDMDRSLIATKRAEDKATLQDAINDVEIDNVEKVRGSEDDLEKEKVKALRRIENLPEGVYVDLEN